MNKNIFVPIRQISYMRLRTWYANLVKPKPTDPPYNHIVQIGDPCLRNVSDKIPKDAIQSPEMKYLIDLMKKVFHRYNCVGLAANQIGVPIRLCLLEFNKKHAKSYSEQEYKNMEMSLLPLTVVINPEIKILNYKKIILPEACESVKGFWANVPRYHAIELTGFNENGETLKLNAAGWTARIIQHEVDHCNGNLFTDIMDRKTLTCSCWEVINERQGRVSLPYGSD